MVAIRKDRTINFQFHSHSFNILQVTEEDGRPKKKIKNFDWNRVKIQFCVSFFIPRLRENNKNKIRQNIT